LDSLKLTSENSTASPALAKARCSNNNSTENIIVTDFLPDISPGLGKFIFIIPQTDFVGRSALSVHGVKGKEQHVLSFIERKDMCGGRFLSILKKDAGECYFKHNIFLTLDA
jgi:hypothetical protein